MAYATVQDLEMRWRALAPSEKERAAVLLDDAAVLLADYDAADFEALKIVSCNMVRRAMETSGDAFGIDGQVVPSMGWADSLPSGELYLKAQERRSLSGRGAIGYVRATRE